MQAVISKVNSVCTRLLDNAELMKLIPENSLDVLDGSDVTLPKYAALGVKNSRRKMEDRHVVIQDFHELYSGKVRSVRESSLGVLLICIPFPFRNRLGVVTMDYSMGTEEPRLQFIALPT